MDEKKYTKKNAIHIYIAVELELVRIAAGWMYLTSMYRVEPWLDDRCVGSVNTFSKQNIFIPPMMMA